MAIDKSVWTSPVFTKRFAAASETLRTKGASALLDSDITTLDTYYGNAEQLRQQRWEAKQQRAAQASRQAPAPANGAGGLTPREWHVLRTLRPLFAEYDATIKSVTLRVTALETERDALRARLAGVEQKSLRPSVRWAGTYEAGHFYEPGELASKGGLWLALRRTDAMPGTAPDDWKLILRHAK